MIKVEISKASDHNFKEVKEFNNEKEMIDYGLSFEKEIILDYPFPDHLETKGFDYRMEIYDYYRE